MKVAHFVRKISQLKASFINNQIINHIDFSPVVISRKSFDKLYDGGFAAFPKQAYPHLELEKEESLYEKLLFKGPKILDAAQQQRILQFLQVNNIKVAHFHYGTDCGIFYPLLKKLNIPSVVSFYGYDCSSFPTEYFGYGSIYLKNRVFKNATAVLAMSPDMKVDLMKAGCPEEKIIVHYYGTDCQKFYYEREYNEKKTVNLMILASLVPQKGHLFLLQSLLKLKEAGVQNWHLRIVGNGELEESLENFVKENKLSEEVTFVGPVNYGSPEMMREYTQADVFVHPSVIAENGDKEGIPGTVIEAMSCGLPIVSTYHAGIPYVIENNKTGLLVKEWDLDALGSAIKSMIDSQALRKKLGMAGQSYAISELDLREKQYELEGIYATLIEKKQPKLV